MSPEKQKELIAIYPPIFTGLNELEPFALFGFQCDDGWFEILKECIEEIKDICESEDEEEVKVTQVKEKFGTLRVYVDGIHNKIYDAIHRAEQKSHDMCESCGQKGKIRNGGWVRVLCDACQHKIRGLPSSKKPPPHEL